MSDSDETLEEQARALLLTLSNAAKVAMAFPDFAHQSLEVVCEELEGAGCLSDAGWYPTDLGRAVAKLLSEGGGR